MKLTHCEIRYMTTAALAAGMLLTASPVLAQRTSTPGEESQTRALNSQAGVQDDSADQAYQDAQKNYQQQKQSYDDQRQKYQDAKDAYDAKKSAYDSGSAEYKDERANYNAEFPDFGDRDVVQLGTVAPRSLLDAPVDSLGGEHLGYVVRIKHHGRDMTIEVDMGAGHHVTVLADSLRYDRDHKMIVAPQTRAQLLADADK